MLLNIADFALLVTETLGRIVPEAINKN